MLWLYNIGISFYGLVVAVFSLFNTKARLFRSGRKNIYEQAGKKLDPSKRRIWFHFASLGEFEQGRPVLEKIKELHPQKSIVITFFSPSGYEIRKNYALAEGVFYLPLDTASNAERFIALLNPEMAVFTKYEYWYHYFEVLKQRSVPLFMISAIFRPDQIFFRWYGTLSRKTLEFVDHFFVQNEESVQLLHQVGIQKVSLSGDTRFDRVAENAKTAKAIDIAAEFCAGHPVFVGGSTWPADEKIITSLIRQEPDWKFILAPHEIGVSHIQEIEKLIPGAVRYSALKDGTITADTQAQVLIIDNIGLLSSLYQYGTMAYIGGGFGVSIHNTLEAAAFGIPVIFGPEYHKFQEAKDLIAIGAAISIQDEQTFLLAFDHFRKHDEAGKIAEKYVSDKTGSTLQILNYIEQQF